MALHNSRWSLVLNILSSLWTHIFTVLLLSLIHKLANIVLRSHKNTLSLIPRLWCNWIALSSNRLCVVELNHLILLILRQVVLVGLFIRALVLLMIDHFGLLTGIILGLVIICLVYLLLILILMLRRLTIVLCIKFTLILWLFSRSWVISYNWSPLRTFFRWFILLC